MRPFSKRGNEGDEGDEGEIDTKKILQIVFELLSKFTDTRNLILYWVMLFMLILFGFLPEDLLKNIGIHEIYNQYEYIMWLLIIIISASLIYRLVSYVYKKKKEEKTNKKRKMKEERKKKKFEDMIKENSKYIDLLDELYKEDPKATWIYKGNRVVDDLVKFGYARRATINYEKKGYWAYVLTDKGLSFIEENNLESSRVNN